MRPTSWTRRTMATIVVTLAAGSLPVTAGQLPNIDEIMREKLEHGERLLEAVVLGQHVAVERHAYELTLLSEASTWTSLRTPEYLRYAAAFREIAERLMTQASERNTEEMSFAYTELVTTCVQCHRHVRGADTAD